MRNPTARILPQAQDSIKFRLKQSSYQPIIDSEQIKRDDRSC